MPIILSSTLVDAPFLNELYTILWWCAVYLISMTNSVCTHRFLCLFDKFLHRTWQDIHTIWLKFRTIWQKKPFGDVLSWNWKQKAKEIATFSTESLFPITMVLFVLPVQIHSLIQFKYTFYWPFVFPWHI